MPLTMRPDLYELLMEYALTMTISPCGICAVYLYERQIVLIPEIVKKAEETNREPVDVFIQFKQGLHDHHIKEKK